MAWGALAGALHQLPQCDTLGKRAETGVQLATGLLSSLTVLTCFRWRRWARPVRVAWAIALATTAFASSLVWGPPSLPVGLAFAAAALLGALGIDWLLRAGLAA